MTIDRRSFEYDDLLLYLSLSRIYPCVSSPIWLEISMYEIAILIVVIVSQRNRRRCRSPWFEKSIHSFQRRGHDHDKAVSYRIPRKSLCWLNGRVESVDLRCSRVVSENGKRGSNQFYREITIPCRQDKSVSMYLCIYVCKYVCMYVCMYVSICVRFGRRDHLLSIGRGYISLCTPFHLGNRM